MPKHRLNFFPKNELIRQYRRVFSSNHGLDVLNHILYDLGVFQETSEGPEDVALKNYGIRLLKIMSGGDPDPTVMKDFTKKLMLQQLPKEN